MGPGHPPGCTHESDLLPTRDSVSLRYQRATHVKVSGDNSITMIDVHDIPGEEEPVNQSDYSAIGCQDRRARASTKIHAKVAR
jgi:hypothetical protein